MEIYDNPHQQPHCRSHPTFIRTPLYTHRSMPITRTQPYTKTVICSGSRARLREINQTNSGIVGAARAGWLAGAQRAPGQLRIVGIDDCTCTPPPESRGRRRERERENESCTRDFGGGGYMRAAREQCPRGTPRLLCTCVRSERERERRICRTQMAEGPSYQFQHPRLLPLPPSFRRSLCLSSPLYCF